MTVYFSCFYLLILICVRESRTVNTDRQQRIVSSLISHLNIKNFILIKDPSLILNPNILSYVKFLAKDKIYGNFFTVNQLDDYLNASDPVPFRHLYALKTMVFQYYNKYSRDMLKLFEEEHEGVNSKYVWLSFINIFEAPEDMFKEVYVPYHCENFVVQTDFKTRFDIWEIFHNHIQNLTLFQNYFGSWTESEGLNASQVEFYERRMDLKRTNITFFTPELPEKYSQETQLHLLIIEHFSRAMNFSSNLQHGNVRGKMNMYSHLFTDYIYDFFLGTISISFEYDIRLKSIHVGPFFKKRAYLYLAYNETYKEYEKLAYLKAFSVKLWIVIIFWAFMSGICFAIMTYIQRKNQINVNAVLTSFLQPFEILMNQGGGEKSRNLQNRTASLSNRIIALFLIPSYTSLLLTIVLVPKIKLPFRNMEEFKKNHLYELGIFFSGGYLLNEEYMSQLFTAERLQVQHDSLEKAVKKICENHNHVLLAFEDPRIINNNECEILGTDQHLFESWDIMLARKNSPYKKIFNRLLKTIHAAGIIDKLETQYFKSGEIGNKKLIPTKSVKLEKLAPIFMIAGVFYTLALLILLLELCFSKINKMQL